jgi:PAS domain S-box-containing protein
MNGKKTKKELAAEVESLRARVKRLQKGTRRKSSGDHDLTVREAFPTIIAAITMPLFVKNADYKFTLLNKGFCNLLGYSNAELLGKSDCDIFPPGEADAFRTSDDLVMQSGTGSTSEMTMTDSAGFVHDVVINKILYCNLKNEKFIVGIVYDVTEQKRLEEDVKASEFRYRSLVHTMNEAVAVHEMIYDASGKPVDYRIIEVNDAFARHTGISTIPKNVLASIFYRMARPPYLETYARVAETAARTFFEASFEPLNKDFAISVFSPQRGLFVTVFTDITERNRTLKALAESERFMRSVLDSLGSRICVLNETGIVLSVK